MLTDAMELPSVEAGETLDKILDAIRKNRIAPCYLLYGEEGYLIRSALDQIISCLLPPEDRDLNLFLIDGDQEDIDRLCGSRNCSTSKFAGVRSVKRPHMSQAPNYKSGPVPEQFIESQVAKGTGEGTDAASLPDRLFDRKAACIFHQPGSS